MVLIRWLSALGLALVGAALPAGCNQSLFDNHGGGGGPGGDGGIPDSLPVPSSCEDPCIADAAANFNDTVGGTNNHWRYLDDRRDRTWTAMAVGSGGMTGAGSNSITTCKASPGSAACTALPGALLITSSGATSAADPAIEFTVPSLKVAQIALRVYVPPGQADQQILLYRGSREDALFTGTAAAGKTLEQTIVLDALAGDRFLLAVAPKAKGAAGVGVQLFASETGAVFPQSCQLALEFDGASGTSIKDLCKNASFDSATAFVGATAISLAPGPFKEQGNGIDLPPGTNSDDGRYLQGSQVLDQFHDFTVQLWMLQRNQDKASPAWPFSDLDLNSGGGLGIEVYLMAPVIPTLDVQTSFDAVSGTPVDTATIGGQNVWQFLRVVHANGTLSVCLNGQLLVSKMVPAGQFKTTFPPYIGKNVIWTGGGGGAYFDGTIDDVRVFSGALPCN